MAHTVYDVRFRHVNGDIGPLSFPLSTPMSDVKYRLWQEWPTDGPLSAERPTSPMEIRLICNGKFPEDGQPLKSVTYVGGEQSSDFLVTFHVIIRPVPTEKAASGVAVAKTSSSGCCVIC